MLELFFKKCTHKKKRFSNSPEWWQNLSAECEKNLPAVSDLTPSRQQEKDANKIFYGLKIQKNPTFSAFKKPAVICRPTKQKKPMAMILAFWGFTFFSLDSSYSTQIFGFPRITFPITFFPPPSVFSRHFSLLQFLRFCFRSPPNGFKMLLTSLSIVFPLLFQVSFFQEQITKWNYSLASKDDIICYL